MRSKFSFGYLLIEINKYTSQKSEIYACMGLCISLISSPLECCRFCTDDGGRVDAHIIVLKCDTNNKKHTFSRTRIKIQILRERIRQRLIETKNS